MSSWREHIFQRKPVANMISETGTDSGRGELARTIGLWQLASIGIGGTIGTGIFFVLNQAVPIAGPAVVISFIIAGIVAGLTAVCYAELASAVPVSGSSYSYAYATLGEMVALGVGACLLLEWGVAGAAVAVGWSEYLNQFLHNMIGIRFPHVLSHAPSAGGLINLPAILLIGMCTLLLMRGASESTTINALMVVIKVGVLVMFVLVGLGGWSSDNLANFAPFGSAGVTAAAGIIFFSFIGLDSVATAGEEAINPRRNMPLAIMLSLLVVLVTYVAVALVAVAAQPSTDFLGQEAGLAQILMNVTGSHWPGTAISAGAVISIFSVTLVSLYGLTRILFTMARDGMIPSVFHRVDPRTRSPLSATYISAAALSLLAGLIPLDFLAEMTSVGTLVAFTTVSIGVMVLRRTAPDQPRGFKVPFYPVTPILSIIGCLYVIAGLQPATLYVFVVWMAVAMVWYFTYSMKHSRLRLAPNAGTTPPVSGGRQ